MWFLFYFHAISNCNKLNVWQIQMHTNKLSQTKTMSSIWAQFQPHFDLNYVNVRQYVTLFVKE